MRTFIFELIRERKQFSRLKKRYEYESFFNFEPSHSNLSMSVFFQASTQTLTVKSKGPSPKLFFKIGHLFFNFKTGSKKVKESVFRVFQGYKKGVEVRNVFQNRTHQNRTFWLFQGVSAYPSWIFHTIKKGIFLFLQKIDRFFDHRGVFLSGGYINYMNRIWRQIRGI